MFEYRVVFKRAGLRRKVKRYASLHRAQRFMGCLGDEPWKALGKDPDALSCCDGRECDCGGMSVREAEALFRKDIPPLEYAHIESREVGKWEK